MLRIDDAQTRAELAIVRGQLVELAAKKARLLAERDGQREVNFPQPLLHQGARCISGVVACRLT